ncbi:ABC transporter ATP-binding protein [Marinomonas mediterranea]|jgi:carbohydrate ABC transporter ATP-binding protein, CUT1 family (TC 3.A.1.1.-)|uniref:Glycerol-3-phosphate-transporting ATPase n=1 Tax=Marinomonas mediterranea (strain ATCC 700492 / JCM 21426 / NBRC 103028 / MMB-1) TaxID=717774 RepID=F2JWH5_MARM1|nr:ABC transporter ATP-binding protein [Marinomonas mediterranea]ADZ90648.1 Glycerol-3-phosphate-transporting ATPase [Marinomonas mediterranea MMB-1]WCN16818.1 ATP-binding cassette domain-containing protein [Marinomonas mediterranea MMB-1]
MSNITLTNISKRYTADHPPAVDNVSMEIEDGAFMCVLGPSGCGKSTILRMIAGLEHLSDGEIAVDCKPLDNVSKGIFIPPEKRHIGLVFQSYALWPHMTVSRNIEFGLKLKGMSKEERLERVAKMIIMLKIEGLEDRYPAQLSGGQQQRVALARTLAMNPGILLLDEPLSNLDAALRLSMRAELTRLHQEFGTTIVFVTHDQWEAMTLATKIAVMSKGELQQLGTPDDIYERPANRFVAEFIGNPPINMIPANTSAAQTFLQAIGYQDTPPIGAQLGLRPEGIDLRRDTSLSSVLATVTDILPTGGAWIIELNVESNETGSDGYHLVHTTQTPPHWKQGEAVYVHVAPHAVHLFSAEGDRLSLEAQPEVRVSSSNSELASPTFVQTKLEDTP